MSRALHIAADEARRIALAAQGFDRQRPKSPNDVRHFRRAMAAILVLQLDFVNVLLPAHFMMFWSRLGAYKRNRLEEFLYNSAEYVEQWAHEASIVSSSDWRLLSHRRKSFKQWKSGSLNATVDWDAYLAQVLDLVEAQGATTANDLPHVEGPRKRPGEWHRSVPRRALEYHFGKGNLAVRRRLSNFQRVYDLPKRVLEQRHRLGSVSKEAAERELLRNAAGALGIATAHDLADYYRMSIRDVATRIEELLEEGDLCEAKVQGWAETAYLRTGAKLPRRIPGNSLLSPFDPVVWFRPRAMRLFEFEYRIEIYVPEAKRRWGYYVLPFRQGDEITARVDLKADRKVSILRVQSAFVEVGANRSRTANSLASELRALATWLDLEQVQVMKSSAFERDLADRL